MSTSQFFLTVVPLQKNLILLSRLVVTYVLTLGFDEI